MDGLIVMDDVMGIADNCKKFAEFLIICRKYRYHCIYIFHKIAPESKILKKILSQTNILTFFCQVCHTMPLLKFFKLIADQQKKKMSLLVQCGLTDFLVTLPTQMNNIAKQLTVVLNKNSPGRYRTHTDDPVK